MPGCQHWESHCYLCACSWQATRWRPMRQLSAPSWRPAGRCKSCLMRRHQAWAWMVSHHSAASAPDTSHGSIILRSASLETAVVMDEHDCIAEGLWTQNFENPLAMKVTELPQVHLKVLAMVEKAALCRLLRHTFTACLRLQTKAPDARAEVVEAVAAAKRALSSHPLPDPFQPSGKPFWKHLTYCISIRHILCTDLWLATLHGNLKDNHMPHLKVLTQSVWCQAQECQASEISAPAVWRWAVSSRGNWLGCCAGAADLVAEAKKHLGVIPTDYDDDGPVPPIQDALLAVADAKLVERLSLHAPRCPWAAALALSLSRSISVGQHSSKLMSCN